ncbi:hypothetical protein BASA81_005666 [Batrachochytrium salamandrivorans]|nr:hypothetical protein BASA81_005666 [Batrachochytrium salamandrivorans]
MIFSISAMFRLKNTLVMAFITAAVATETKLGPTVGVSTANLYRYAQLKPGTLFNCFDGTRSIPFDSVNDDYCDCEDGSDEPGTSACDGGTFSCINKGHIESHIPSSRVNDGVCDEACCDGSDEYSSNAKCSNQCAKQAVAYASMTSEAESIRRQGALVKLQYIEDSKHTLVDRTKEIENLRLTLKLREAEVAVIREEQAKVEKLEKQQLENQQEYDAKDSCKGYTEKIDKWLDTLLLAVSLLEPKKADTEINKVLAIRDSIVIQRQKEVDDAHKANLAESGHNYTEELHAIEDKLASTNLLVGDAISQIDTISKEVDQDFGPENVFYMLRKQCVEMQHLEYNYKLCFLDTAHQGGTSLGTFSSWGSDGAGDKYHEMNYSGGDQCWNGPARSVKVKLTCGVANALVDIQEPNKCEYVFMATTPAVCEVSDTHRALFVPAPSDPLAKTASEQDSFGGSDHTEL